MHPPKFPLRFFRWFCHADLRDTIEGDLRELYMERRIQSGKRKADRLFIADVLLLLRPGIIRLVKRQQNLNTCSMFKSYFKIGWRSLVKNKGYSFINIGGLALGMAVAIMIGLWINDELTFNRYHKNYDRIGQVYRNNLWHDEMITSHFHPTGLGTLLRHDYGARFQQVAMVRGRNEDHVITSADNKYTQRGYFMQPEGISLFSFNLIQGNQNALTDINSIILSESLAQKLFLGGNALNQVISMDAKWDLKVTAVYEDLPRNSVFQDASYFAPLDLYLNGWSSLDVWDNYNIDVYVQLNPNETFSGVSSAVQKAMLPHVDENMRTSKPEIFIHPMKDWHLASEFQNGIQVTSPRMNSVWYYGIIGCFVLLLACINFMNLTTARSEKRAKEVGIRKSIGSLRSQLVKQFYSESLMVSSCAFLLSLILVQVCMPGFNAIAAKDLSLPVSQPLFWLGCLLFVLFTSLVAGSYPALYLSSFNPVRVLKGTFKAGRFSSIPRKALVTVQFTVSISLMIGTTIVYQQIQFGKNRTVGYSRNGLISLHPRTPEFQGKHDILRNELIKTGVVEEIAESDYSLTSTLGWNGGFEWAGKNKSEQDPSFNINAVTVDYGKTIGWQFIAGRDFSRAFSNEGNRVVINESAARLMGLADPVGEILTRTRRDSKEEFIITGVIKDVVKGSPFERTDPCLYFLSDKTLGWLYIRLKPLASPHTALQKIESVFKQIVPSAPFDYTFADDDYAVKFESEERIGTLATIFSVLAIAISCLGLFGLASFVAEQRTKEIGIRKVLGADIYSLWRMMSQEFVVLVIISCGIAAPMSFSFMNGWLQHYEYHTSISWIVFGLACMGALIITLITISYQAIKAALANPVNSLRSE